MPFTFSHPAAVIPLNRWGLVLSALVVGSLSPDLIYFFCLSFRCRLGHTLVGIIVFDIPAGLVLIWLYHTVLKFFLIALFPIAHQPYLIPFLKPFHFFSSWQRFGFILCSLTIGALTHIAWDSLTHRSGWVVQQLPVLTMSIIQTNQGSLKIYKVLQYASTLLGAALLFYWYFNWLRQAPKQPINSLTLLSAKTKLFVICFIVLTATIGASVYGFVQVNPFDDFYSFYQFMGLAVVAGIAIVFIEVVIFSVYFKFYV
jgi:hypothetical protein